MWFLNEYLDRIGDKNRWDVWNNTHTSSENEDHASSIWMIICAWQDVSIIFCTSEIDRYTMIADNIRSVLMIVSDLYKKKLKLWCSSIRIGLCRARFLIYLNICFSMIKRNTIRMNSVEPCVQQNLNWSWMVWNRRFLISRDRCQKTDLQSSQRKFQRETSCPLLSYQDYPSKQYSKMMSRWRKLLWRLMSFLSFNWIQIALLFRVHLFDKTIDELCGSTDHLNDNSGFVSFDDSIWVYVEMRGDNDRK